MGDFESVWREWEARQLRQAVWLARRCLVVLLALGLFDGREVPDGR